MPVHPAAAARPPQHMPFTQFLQHQRRGLLHAELTEAFAEVVAAVVRHGKTGKLTVTFTMKPKGDSAIEIADAYVAKAPTPPASASLFFADEIGRLSRDRLDQPKLPFEAVDGGRATGRGGDGGSEASGS